MSYWKKFKKKYMGDRAFYRHYLLLAVPMILQNAINESWSVFLDNIMGGTAWERNRCPVLQYVNQLYFCVQSGNFWSGVGGKYFWCAVFWQWGSQGTYAFVSF